MKVIIIKHHNDFPVEKISSEVTTMKEMEQVKNEILSSFNKKKSEIINAGFPYQQMEEGSFYGFISDSYQFIQSNWSIDIQEGNEHIQYVFLFSNEMEVDNIDCLIERAA